MLWRQDDLAWFAAGYHSGALAQCDAFSSAKP